jgi:K+-transporting ATPase KdpF subunit
MIKDSKKELTVVGDMILAGLVTIGLLIYLSYCLLKAEDL